MAGSSVHPPVVQRGYGSERCSVCARCQGRRGCSTLSSASISLNPSLLCHATETYPVDRSGLSATGRRSFFFFCILLFCCSFNLSSAFPASSKLMSHLCPLIFAVPGHVWRRCPLTHSHVCSGTQEDLRPLHQTSVQIAVWPTELPQLRSSQTAGASP